MAALDDPRVGELVREAIAFLPDAARMFAGVIRDPRVPRRAKLEAAACFGLLAVPFEAIPVVGELELVAVATLAARRLVGGAGEVVLREHWQGSERGFELLMLLVATGLRPRKALRHMVFSGAKAPGGGQGGVIDGEVVGRR